MTPTATPGDVPQGRQQILLSYALLTGLTPLIPVPLADDLAKNHLRRQLVRRLARAHGLDLSADAAQSLAREQGGAGGCLGGCLTQALLYPIKKIFRKVFFFLEWKRAVDLTSYTYHWGYLLDYALGEGLLAGPTAAGAGTSVDDLRTAIERACRDAPIRPLERVVGATLRQSHAALLSAARRIWAGAATADADAAAASTGPAVREQADEVSEVSGVAALLQQRIASAVPEEHFQDLRRRFRAHLAELNGLREQGR